jgi:hypothetical protein
MSVRKLPFIQSVKLATIDESDVIPTTLYYDQGRPIIGREAREKCVSPELLIEDFKVELGRIDPDNPVRRSNSADKSPRRTALGLAKDYFEEALKKLDTSLAVQGLVAPNKILIAEPLSLADSDKATEAWLSNYRRSIRKVLLGRFAEIDFLPEPFQHYEAQRDHRCQMMSEGNSNPDAASEVWITAPSNGEVVRLVPLGCWQTEDDLPPKKWTGLSCF